MSETSKRQLPPDPRTVAEMIPVREAQIAALEAAGKTPECEIHGPMHAPLAGLSYELMYCGTWFKCCADGCRENAHYLSPELAAYHGEPYVAGGHYEQWNGTAWETISDREADAYWRARAAERDARERARLSAARRKPTVAYAGRTYKVRSHKTEIPDLDAMDRMAALIWLNQNTYATGVGTRTRPNPLAGLGDVISVTVR